MARRTPQSTSAALRELAASAENLAGVTSLAGQSLVQATRDLAVASQAADLLAENLRELADDLDARRRRNGGEP
jgi:hypothetical protein